MTLAVINPGGWDPEEVLTSDQMNAMQAEMVKAIDGVRGGSYTLTADLVMDGGGEWVLSVKVNILGDLVIESGAFLQVLGTIQLSGVETLTGTINVTGPGGTINVQEDGFIRVKSDGAIDIESGAALGISGIASVFGQLDIKTGGRIDLEGTAHIDLAGTSHIDLAGTSRINLASGTKIIGSINAEVKVDDAGDLTIDSSLVVFRVTLTPIQITATAGVPDFVTALAGKPTWRMHNATAAGWIAFALPLHVGDVITTLRLTLIGAGAGGGGGHSGDVGTRPRFQLIEMALDGSETQIATFDDPVTAHASYDVSHTITLSAATPGALLPRTVTDKLLFCRVRTEGGANAAADTTEITGIDGTLNANSFRAGSEFY